MDHRSHSIFARSSRYSAFFLLGILLGGCTKWPPYETEIASKFESYRESFEVLESKIKASDYVRVSQTGILGIPRFKDSYDVVADIDKGEIVEQDIIKDDREWEEHFRKAGIFSVAYRDSAAMFGFVGDLPVKNRSVWAEIVHSSKHRGELRPCLDEHKQLGCGLCAVDLDSEWFIRYWWTPEEQVPGGFERVLDDEITEDEYWSIFDENLSQCRQRGYSAIGYDTSGWKNQEN